jgi:hypothetical protein
VPSGCQATFDETSDSTSTAGMIPSIFFKRLASSDEMEKTYIAPSEEEVVTRFPLGWNEMCLTDFACPRSIITREGLIAFTTFAFVSLRQYP